MECDFTRKSRSNGDSGSTRLGVKLVALAMVLLLGTTIALAQGLQGKVVGTVTDPTGAVVVGAAVELEDQATAHKWNTKTGANGQFVFMALQSGLYKATVRMQGFNTGVFPNIKVDLGRVAEVDAKLTVGATTSEVVVEAAGEMLSTASSAVESTITGRSVRSVPLNNRDALDFVMLLPGAQQAGQARTGTFNALPHSALSITMDGINVQDNTLKSEYGGGMFTLIRPKQDVVEELSVTSSTPGADAGADGVVQIKFTTRRGGNAWHGGVFEQYRDQGLNANTYLQNRQQSPTRVGCYGIVGGDICRPKNHLNQYGFNVGGPVIKNKLFVFGNFEDFKLPASQFRSTPILNAAAQSGSFTYVADCNNTTKPCAPGVVPNQVITRNLFSIADAQMAAGGCAITLADGSTITNCRGTALGVDPFVGAMLAQANALTAGGIFGPNDRNRQTLSWYTPAPQRRYFPAARIDFDATSKLRMGLTGQWNHFESNPDTLNYSDPSLPGGKALGGQYGPRWLLSYYLNYVVNNNLNYEFRIGKQSAQTKWFPESTRDAFAPNGVQYDWPSNLATAMPFGCAPPYNYAWGACVDTFSTRNAPVIQINNSFGWLHGRHTINFGSTIEILKYWSKDINYGGVPIISLGLDSSDPADSMFSNGATAADTLPNATATDLSFAKSLYGLLAGRVDAIYTSNNVDENTHAYSPASDLIQRARQNVLAFYVTDSFRFKKTLTLNYGLRWEYQAAMYNVNGIYANPSWQDLWGQSGVGNLFKPGTLTGPAQPSLQLRPQGLYDPGYKNFAPSFGFSWSPEINNGLYNKVFGGPGKTVFRGAYSLAYTREGISMYTGYAGNNPGRDQSVFAYPEAQYASGSMVLNGNLTPSSYVDLSGPSGTPGVQSAGMAPRSAFPTTFMQEFPQSWFTFGGANIRTIDPNFRVPYVQSWQFGIQRELSPNTVLEVRYVGNHGTRLTRGVNINEVNIFENGFLTEFKQAQANLAINRANGLGSSYRNNGLPGQAAMPIIDASGVSKTSSARISNLDTGQAGTFATYLATTSSTLCPLVGTRLQACADLGYTNAGTFPVNLFQVNPDMAGNTVNMMTNASWSKYNGLQVELRRRMSKGLMVNVAYTWSHGTTNAVGDPATNFYTLRDLNLNNGPSPWDLRHTLRVFWIYELPFGPGRTFSFNNRVVNKIAEGWEISGVVAAQSGRLFKLTSGRGTVNGFTYSSSTNSGNSEGGVILHDFTPAQLQNAVGIDKSMGNLTACDSLSYVYFLNTSLKDPVNCQANKAIIDNPVTPGEFGLLNLFARGSRFVKPDLTLTKKTRVTERVNTEVSIRAYNAFNYSNWLVGGTGAVSNGGFGTSINSSGFGRTNSFFQDLGNQDQGPRMIELVFRVNF